MRLSHWIAIETITLSSSLATTTQAYEVYMLGTSATNCHGVDRDKIIPAQLQIILRADDFDATVSNGGVDGDIPANMLERLKGHLTADTKVVIFEPGPNDRNKTSSIAASDEILSYLQSISLKTIYISSPATQTPEEAKSFADAHGATYYGSYGVNIPLDAEHYQFDFYGKESGKGRGGHMTAAGCQMAAANIAPLVETVLREIGLH